MVYMDAAYRQCLNCGIQNECRLDKAERFRRIRDEHARADKAPELENED